MMYTRGMKKLNKKHLTFCEAYVRNGFNGSKAYQKAYGVKPNVAKVEANRLLSDSLIQEFISSLEGSYKILGQSFGMDRKFILKRLKRLMEQKKKIYFKGAYIDEIDDTTAQNNAIVTFLKMTGDLAPEKYEFKSVEKEGLNPAKMSKEERDKLKADILKEI